LIRQRGHFLRDSYRGTDGSELVSVRFGGLVSGAKLVEFEDDEIADLELFLLMSSVVITFLLLLSYGNGIATFVAAVAQLIS
jgi:hypothetical protein